MTDPIVLPDSDNLKRCTKCGELKPRGEFHRNSSCKDGLATWCKVCACENSKHWLSNNREQNRANSQRWSDANREYKQEQNRLYVATHKEQKRTYDKAYGKTNKERKRENTRRYHQTDKGRASRKANVQLRRARMLHAPGRGVTPADLIEIQNGQTDKAGVVRCWWCGQAITTSEWHVDHRIPISKGGAHDPSNCCLSCQRCNQSKGSKHPTEWAGRLL